MKKTVFLPLLLLIFLGLSDQTKAKKFYIDSVKVHAHVLLNGNIEITEYRTYTFDGSFSWADYRLPKKGYDYISNWSVAERGFNYSLSESEDVGTFEVRTKKKTTGVKWYFNAKDEQRTFIIRYLIEGGIVVGEEHAEWYWILLSSKWEKKTHVFSAEITFQKEAFSKIYTWIEGGASPEVSILPTEPKVTIDAQSIGKRRYIASRLVFPSSFVSNATVTNPEFTLNWAIAQEEAKELKRIRDAERDEQMKSFLQPLLPVFGILSIVVFVVLYRKYTLHEEPTHTVTDLKPNALHPVEASWLLNQRSVPNSYVVSSLMRLVSFGYLSLNVLRMEKKTFTGEKPIIEIEKKKSADATLAQHDKLLLEFVEAQLSEGNQYVHELFRKPTMKVHSFLTKWRANLTKAAIEKEWYHEEAGKGLVWNAVIQSILLVLSIVAVIWVGPLALIPCVIAFIGLFLSLIIRRRTQRGEFVYSKLKELRKKIRDSLKKKDTSLSDGIPLYLLLVLGIEETYLKTALKKRKVEFDFGSHFMSAETIDMATVVLIMSTQNDFYGGAVGAGPGSASAGGASAGAAGGGAGGGAG